MRSANSVCVPAIRTARFSAASDRRFMGEQHTTDVVRPSTTVFVRQAPSPYPMLRRMETMGERLRRARLARDVQTQGELGRLVKPYLGRELDQQTISAIERRKSVRTTFLYAFAAALRVNPEWLQTGRGDSGLSGDGWSPTASPSHNQIKGAIVLDKDLQAIFETWNTVGNVGRSVIRAALRSAKDAERAANSRGSPATSGVQDAGARDAGGRAPVHVPSGQRHKRRRH